MILEQEIDIELIKDLTKQIEKSGGIELVKKKATHETSRLADNVRNCSFSMLSRIKLNLKTYTINENNWLRNLRISEDEDAFNELDTVKIFSLLEDALEEFYNLAAKFLTLFDRTNTTFFLQRNLKGVKTFNHIYFVEMFSKITLELECIYVVNKGGKYIVLNEKFVEIEFIDYVKKYFGFDCEEEFQKLKCVLEKEDGSHLDVQGAFNCFCKYCNDDKEHYKFQKGVITFLDFLAWKGLWLQKSNDDSILNTVSNLIKSFRNVLNRFTYELYQDSNHMELSKLLSISDTIAIFTPELGQ